MEGSVAAAPAANDGQQGTDAQVQQGQGTDAGAVGIDAAAINDTLAGLASQQEEMRNFLQSAPWAQAAPGTQDAQTQAAEPQVPAADLSFLDPASPTFDAENAGDLLANAIQQQVQATSQQLVQDAITPLQQQLAEAKSQQEADALAAEYPELAQPEVAKQVIDTTKEYVSAMNLPPELAGNMGMIRLVYMAARAADAANQQGAQGAQAATLEGGAGARPGGSQGGLTVDQIVGAGGRRNVLPFA
jgi:hypothetical protein